MLSNKLIKEPFDSEKREINGQVMPKFCKIFYKPKTFM